MIDYGEVRSQFPALARVHHGNQVAYFDGPGGTQVPRSVAAAMTDYLFHHNANTHWNYPTSAETDHIIESSRGAMADFFNCSPDEVVFGANMTTLTFHLARGLAANWGPGDEIVVTELDHHANVAPWQRLAIERGVTVHVVRMIPQTGQLDWTDLEKKMSRKTRLLAIGAASNALGTINDLPRAMKLAKAFGALTFVDAVHYAAHALIDVEELGCDFLACSAYKFYGPHIGVLYGRSSLLADVDVPKLLPSPNEAPDRIETGTQNHEGIAGTAAAVDFLAGLGGHSDHGTRRARIVHTMEALHARGNALLEGLWHGLSDIPGVQVFGPAPGHARTPTVSFVIDKAPSAEAAATLANQGIFLSHGNFYAMTVAERLGFLDRGLLRAGCACYTTEDEVRRLVAAVRAIA